jgi:exosortase
MEERADATGRQGDLNMSGATVQEMTEASGKASAWHVVALLAPAWVVSAWLIRKASWFWSHNPDLQFGYVVVLLCGYLIWEGWGQRPPLSARWGWLSIGCMLLGGAALFLTQIYQAAYGMTPASLSGLGFGFALCVVGSLHYVFGWPGVRTFAFGFLFLLIALPIPSVIYTPIVGGLQSKVAAVNTEVLGLLGIPAQKVGSLIHLPNGTVGIDEACSGIRSLQSTVMASLFIGYLTLKWNRLRLTLLALGVGLAILGNVIRSLYLCLMAYWRGIESISKVHDTAGWSVLAFTAVGVVLISWVLAQVEKMVEADRAADGEDRQSGAGRQGRGSSVTESSDRQMRTRPSESVSSSDPGRGTLGAGRESGSETRR